MYIFLLPIFLIFFKINKVFTDHQKLIQMGKNYFFARSPDKKGQAEDISPLQARKENKLWFLSHLGCEVKTLLSLREKATITFNDLWKEVATARHLTQ